MISIIVPVYNAQKYIKRCVESIVNQTYKDWELFLIDDGSKDESGTICDQLAKSDSRIQVFHTENQGASAARNRGLDEATGEYVTFVDADDWIETNHLQVLIDQVLPDVDLCINSFITDLYYGTRPYCYKQIQTHDNLESLEMFFSVLNQHSQFLWNKLFKRKIIEENSIIFNTNISLGEDNIFILEYLNYIHGLSASPACTYHYDQIDENPFSLGRRKRSSSEFLYQLKANRSAILKLYEKYKLDIIKCYGDNYFFTEFFLRIVITDKSIRKNLLLDQDDVELSDELSALNTKNIKDSIIRKFWYALQVRHPITAKFMFLTYLIKQKVKGYVILLFAFVKNKKFIKYGNIKRKNI